MSSPTQRALDPDATAMGFDDPLDDGEAKACTSTLAPTRLPEPIEDLRQLFSTYSNPRVCYEEPHFTISRHPANGDMTARLGEFDGIAYQVVEYLKQPIAISPDVGNVRRHFDLQSNGSRNGEQCLCLHGIGAPEGALHFARRRQQLRLTVCPSGRPASSRGPGAPNAVGVDRLALWSGSRTPIQPMGRDSRSSGAELRRSRQRCPHSKRPRTHERPSARYSSISPHSQAWMP